MNALTNSNAVYRENDFQTTEVNERVAPAVAPKKSKTLLDVSAFKSSSKAKSGEVVGKFKQTVYLVKKPGSRDFFRVHPSEDYRIYGVGIVTDDERNSHIVHPDYEPPENVERFVSAMTLLTCITQKGNVFLWPIKESENEWSRSANAVAKMAISEWVRTRPNMAGSCYDTEQAPEELQAVEPVWPTLSFQEILNSAFEGRVVDNDDYPLIKQLQGRA